VGLGREEGVGREGGICVIGFRGDGRHWLLPRCSNCKAVFAVLLP